MKAMERKYFVKGEEVWFVRIEDFEGLKEQSVIIQGKVIGGGDRVAIIRWESGDEKQRMSAADAATQYQRSKDDAIARAMSLLMSRRDQAARDAERCTSQLQYLNEMIGAVPT
jgi:hypothetical protein